MEIFLVLIVVGVLWFLTKLIYQSNSNALSNSKYRNDLEKQRREKEEQRKIYADRDNADGKWWISGNHLPPKEKKKEPEIKKGKRGGRYTEDKTKDGRPYRRYF